MSEGGARGLIGDLHCDASSSKFIPWRCRCCHLVVRNIFLVWQLSNSIRTATRSILVLFPCRFVKESAFCARFFNEASLFSDHHCLGVRQFERCASLTNRPLRTFSVNTRPHFSVFANSCWAYSVAIRMSRWKFWISPSMTAMLSSAA